MSGERAPHTDSTHLRIRLGFLLINLLLVALLTDCVFGFAQEPEQLTPLSTPIVPGEELGETREKTAFIYILLASIAISLITIVLEGFDRFREYKRTLKR